MKENRLPRPAPRPARVLRPLLWGVVALLVAGALGLGSLLAAGGAQADAVQVQLLAINDVHGQLEPTVRTSDRRPIGGAAVLAAYLDAHEQEAVPAGATSLR